MPGPKVTLAHCHSYEPEEVAAAVAQIFDALGGIDRFASRGQRILIKPNLLSDHLPEQAVTTHPEVVRAIVRLLKPSGAEVIVADSPASITKLESVWQKSGFQTLCDEEKVELLNLERGGSTRIDKDKYTFYVANAIMEADLVINVPKVKTHVLTTLTCAVKNLYGTLPGYQKAELHKRYPSPTPTEFGGLLKAIHDTVTPGLNIADGVVGMQGNGPSGGEPAQLGFLAASTDAYALDSAVCTVLNIPHRAVPYLEHPHPYELPQDLSLGGFSPDAFSVPNTTKARMVPGWLVRVIAPLFWVRPAFNNNCIRCERCVKACPVEALSLNRSAGKPQLHAARCIGCCCCHEMCPANAISMQTSPLLRALGALQRSLRRKEA